ncbi:TspO/MBR family protein [Bordetella sp. N]|uniref:TspO/MBR family protein n=1 Tax=Bordetella sp. N TaxID=1746199 RepID=UPI000709BC67|nr:TspO/MBR family protein [Bordetella sp. N]ALM86119.1 sensory protein [Bordetella sp. N]
MASFSTRRQVIGLVGWLAPGFITAALGAIASVQAAAFYAQLVQPTWAPPAGVFGPAWTTLYILMSLAAWWVWRAGGWRLHGGVLRLYVIQLAVNALWSWLFFAWHLGAWAFVNICVLWLLIVATLIGFWRVRALAGLLLVPYLAWVSFATALCYRVWRDNPGLLG